MATNSVVLASFSPGSLNRQFSIYLKETKYEFLKYLRLPVYSFSVVMLPLMFYVLFGLFMNRQGSIGPVGLSTYRELRNIWRDGCVAVRERHWRGFRTRVGMDAG